MRNAESGHGEAGGGVSIMQDMGFDVCGILAGKFRRKEEISSRSAVMIERRGAAPASNKNGDGVGTRKRAPRKKGGR